MVEWSCSGISKTKFKYESEKMIAEVPNYIVEKAKYFYDNKIARISISSADPDGLKGLDFRKLKIARQSSAFLDKYLSEFGFRDFEE